MDHHDIWPGYLRFDDLSRTSELQRFAAGWQPSLKRGSDAGGADRDGAKLFAFVPTGGACDPRPLQRAEAVFLARSVAKPSNALTGTPLSLGFATTRRLDGICWVVKRWRYGEDLAGALGVAGSTAFSLASTASCGLDGWCDQTAWPRRQADETFVLRQSVRETESSIARPDKARRQRRQTGIVRMRQVPVPDGR